MFARKISATDRLVCSGSVFPSPRERRSATSVLVKPKDGVCATGAAWAPGAEVSGANRMTPSPAGLPSQVIDVRRRQVPFSLDCTGQVWIPGAVAAVGRW